MIDGSQLHGEIISGGDTTLPAQALIEGRMKKEHCIACSTNHKSEMNTIWNIKDMYTLDMTR